MTGAAPGRDGAAELHRCRADEVVVVDAPPEMVSRNGSRRLALHARLAQQLSQLRERALLLTADVVDRQLEAYLELHGVESSWGTQERILVCMTPRANATAMLASGRRNADRFHGELFAIYVNQPQPDVRRIKHRERTERQGSRGRNARRSTFSKGRIRSPPSSTTPGEHGITQLFVGHNLRRGWRRGLARQPARSADPTTPKASTCACSRTDRDGRRPPLDAAVD